MIETLLNSLESERYVRGPLLLTVADELKAAGLLPAAHVAEALVARVEERRISDVEFADEVRTLRSIVRSLAPMARASVAVAAA
ncbi:MAG: hypothetical protein JST00_00345 [Deltaproteobacteria bacterium]|nr:hypothetical protein [Deltaproteobacteria bacterium]